MQNYINKGDIKMACKNICRLCEKLIISTAVNYDAVTNELIIGIPDGTYYNNEKYCFVVVQPIPTTTSISATVVISIGTDPTRYPLVRRNCQQATACNIRTRTKYSVCVATNTISGVFKLLGDIGCCGEEVLVSLPVPTATATTFAVREIADSNKITKTTTTTKKEVLTRE